jgi:hypothetical protein
LPPSGFAALDAKTPVRIEPVIPPIPWHAKTSSVSSSDVRALRRSALKLASAVSDPIATAASGGTKPAPGVMPTSPTTAPVAAPTAVAWPPK